MKTELETVKIIRIMDEGFPWNFKIWDDPEFPEQGIIINHSQEGKVIEEMKIPKSAIEHIVGALTSFSPKH